MANAIWQCGRFELSLQQPLVMGIVNLTPDSFSDGGDYSSHTSLALKHAEDLLKSGADILDIGGESTRPGSDQISTTTEWQRIEPVLTELVKWNVPISLDTRRTEVMQRALDRGVADMINDVAALSDDGAVSLLAAHQRIGICLMHMQGEPKTMQHQPHYENVVEEVVSFLNQRVMVCENAGISRARLMVDPGIGFGKNLMHNLELMRHLRCLSEKTGLPLLLGVSRKRMIAELTGEADPKQRMMGSVAAALAGVAQGAAVVRVHDVKATVDALKVWQAVME